jgi:peptide/nickel transport system permease protein
MGRYLIRRTLVAVPTLLGISFVIFAILDLAPNDPTGNLPQTIPPEVRAEIRASLGFDEPFLVRYSRWLGQMLVDEPLALAGFGDRTRIISWASRAPVMDTILERLPQTLWVMGLAFVLGILIAVPLGVVSAYRQYSLVDQIGTFFSMIGYSVPTFFTGLVAIIVFSVWLGWFPSFYNNLHRVTDLESLWFQLRQIAMPVAVLALFNAAALARFTRSSMLESLGQDYIRTARSKGVEERGVLVRHALRNSLIPVVTLIALQIPGIFAGAIITEQIFRINGLGQALITAINGADLPMVQTLTFIFAVLVVAFNLVADVMYGVLDPRIRYD